MTNLPRHQRYLRHARVAASDQEPGAPMQGRGGSWFDQRVDDVVQTARRIVRSPEVQAAVERARTQRPRETQLVISVLSAAKRAAGSVPVARVLRALAYAALVPYAAAKYVWESGRE